MRVARVGQQGSEVQLDLDFGPNDLRGGKLILRDLTSIEAKNIMSARTVVFYKPKGEEQKIVTFGKDGNPEESKKEEKKEEKIPAT